jgi:hypothetical protein
LVATHYSDPQVHLERFVDLPDPLVIAQRGKVSSMFLGFTTMDCVADITAWQDRGHFV